MRRGRGARNRGQGSDRRTLGPGDMQNVINTVKGTALGVAEFLTPVLKVSEREL